MTDRPRLADESLVLAIRTAVAAGDPEAASAGAADLWLRYDPYVKTLVARKVPLADRDDVVSAVTYATLQFLYRRTTQPDRYVAYLHGIVGHAIADYHAGRRPAEELPEEIGETRDPGFDRILDRDELDPLLARLDPREREVVEAIAADEDRAAIAARLGITAGNLYVIDCRARQKLRAWAAEVAR